MELKVRLEVLLLYVWTKLCYAGYMTGRCRAFLRLNHGIIRSELLWDPHNLTFYMPIPFFCTLTTNEQPMENQAGRTAICGGFQGSSLLCMMRKEWPAMEPHLF